MLTPSLRKLVSSIEDPDNADMVRTVLVEYASLEKRFLAGDWTPAECNAGRFCEALVAPLSNLDRGVILRQKPGEFCKKLLNDDIKDHRLTGTDRRNLARIISAAYEVRSSRNSVHFAPEYTADYVDAMVVLAMCKWLVCELIRLTTGHPNVETVEAIRGVSQLGDPIIYELEGRPVVMRTDLSAAQEILLLLLHRPGYRATKAMLIESTDGMHSANAINTALSRLVKKREVLRAKEQIYQLSPLGAKSALRVHESLAA